MLLHGAPKLDENGKPVRDRHGRIIYEPYRIKVLNTINFSKSMKYNPLAYVRSEKDILKLVNVIIANTKGDGEKSSEDFWVKAEQLLYCALIGYIWYEAEPEERNFITLLDLLNACEAREDDETYKSPVDMSRFTPPPLTGKDDLESIYNRFNVDRPADFTGHSLSVSDIVVLHQDGKDTAHYCDRFGFSQVPEFLQPERAAEVTIPTPDQMATQERISTPRGSFCVTAMSREQMEAAGYGVHHQSEDGKYLIMGNGTRAFAVAAEQPEKDNPLRTAEMTLEDDYGMIDGVINNGRRGEELEKAREHAERTQPEKKPSIRERLAEAKRECAARQAEKPLPEKKPPELGER